MKLKRGGWALWVSVFFVVFLIVFLFFYFTLYSRDRNVQQIYLENPISNLTDSQAVEKFDESFVTYLLYSIKAHTFLHNPPLSKELPEIIVYVDELVYNSFVEDGIVKVGKGEIESPDIKIRTTKLEAVNMLRNKDYVKESFNSGKSGVELVAGKAVLFSKGYLNFYSELNGKSVTGNVIRIYAD